VFDFNENGIMEISTYEQLEYALTCCYKFDSFSYSDEYNSDYEIYGNLNSHSFVLLNDIDCKNRTITIDVNVTFMGELNGNGYTISNLTVKRTSKSKGTGIFLENYGYIHDIKFKDCTYDLTDDVVYYTINNRKVYTTDIAFLCPANYGTIQNVELSSIKCMYKNTEDKQDSVVVNTNRISFR
jgi:hypothetical protein